MEAQRLRDAKDALRKKQNGAPVAQAKEENVSEAQEKQVQENKDEEQVAQIL